MHRTWQTQIITVGPPPPTMKNFLDRRMSFNQLPTKVSESTLVNNYYCRLPRDCQGLGTSNYSLFVSVREVRVLD